MPTYQPNVCYPSSSRSSSRNTTNPNASLTIPQQQSCYPSSNIRTYLHYLPTFLIVIYHAINHYYQRLLVGLKPTYIPTYIPTHQPTYLHTYLPTYMPTYKPNACCPSSSSRSCNTTNLQTYGTSP